MVDNLSSNGLKFNTHNALDDELIRLFGNECLVPDGELMVLEPDGSFMERKKGNGILTKAIRGTLPEEYKDRIVYVLFDLIDYTDWLAGASAVPYKERFNRLSTILKDIPENHKIRLVDTIVVKSEKEAYQHFKKLYDAGEEGTILKDFSCPWENKRSKYQIKYKGVLTCDLRVVEFVPGKGKYSNMIGSLICKSSDDLLEVNVSGMTDDQRKLPEDFWVDKIVEIAYNEVIKNKKNPHKWSLFLPRLLAERFDKNVADSFDLIPKQKPKKRK